MPHKYKPDTLTILLTTAKYLQNQERIKVNTNITQCQVPRVPVHADRARFVVF